MLTTAQITTLRADFAHRIAQGDPLFNQSLKDAANSADDATVAVFYNSIAVPDFFVWQTACPVNDILDAIIWANFTPAATPDTTQVWANRALQCQGKQFNLQNLLLNRTVIDASRDNVRAGFQDALTGLPSGPAGANQGAGAAAVATAMSRQAKVVEKLLANTTGGSGTQGAPAKLVFEGRITDSEAGSLR